MNRCKTLTRSLCSQINRHSSSSSSTQTITTKTTTSSTYIAYDLTNHRSLIKIKGQDSSKYLQNLITNDVNKLQTNNSIYSMILNNRGRILYDILVYRKNTHNISHNNNDDEYLIEYDSFVSNDLLKFLNVYMLKKKVEISPTNLKLYSLVKQEDNDQLNNDKPIKNAFHCSLDPRTNQLGFRCLLDANQSIDQFKNVQLKSDLNKYKINLYKNGIAENHEDMSYQNSIPLEYNLVLMNGVSFNKGCYLGQELIAKTHHTGVVRKRIMPIKLKVENLSIQESMKLFKQDNLIINLKTGKQVGKLRNLIGKHGIAMLRLSELDKNNLALVDVSNANHLIDFHIPDYWHNDQELIKDLKERNLI